MDDHHHTIYLTGNNLTIEDVINVAENGEKYKVEFPKKVIDRIKDDRKALEYMLTEYPEIKIYGTNVGCGDLKDNSITGDTNNNKLTPESFEDYQIRYIKAHNCGTGEALPEKIVRAIMVIRLNSFAKGISAMHLDTCMLMINMLNGGVTPWVLEEGSVGASGDLVPLAMIGAVLIGLDEAKAYFKGEPMDAKKALKMANLKEIRLGAKEAMGLTNGSNFIAAIALFAVKDLESLIKNASIAGALSLEAIRGARDAFSSFVNENRPHVGQLVISKQIRDLVEGSMRTSIEAQNHPFTNGEIVETLDNMILNSSELELTKDQVNTLKKLVSEKEGKDRVQDRYSFRAIPQVHGAVYEANLKLREVVTLEINSATDNPLFEWIELEQFKEYVNEDIYYRLLNDKKIPLNERRKKKKMILKAYSGANFHGQPLATVIDYVKLSLTSLGLITDKRTYSLLDKHQSYGLHKDLAVSHAKGDTGLMIAQYAGAARVAECRVLSSPASVTSIATCANQEDFVSMGSIGVLHLNKIIKNIQLVVGIELLCAMRGIQLTTSEKELPKNLQKLGKGTTIIYEYLIRQFGKYKGDLYMRTEMEKMFVLVKENKLLNALEGLLD